jgi:DNA-binding transcriptional LysR family regulator
MPADLAAHSLISFRDFSAKALVTQAGRKAMFDPKSAIARLLCDDGQSQKIATMAGAGISINSMWSVHRELEEGSLVRVLPNYRLDQQTALWLVYPKSNVLTAKVRVFIDFLLDEVGGALSKLD